MKNKYSVIADKEKNRLYIYLYVFDLELSEKITDEIFTKAQQLAAGWGCIVDFTALGAFTLTWEVLEKIENVISFLKPLGVGQLVRVLNENQDPFHDEIKKRSIEIAGYEGIKARTVQEADSILNLIPD
jgi:hypothetical protein